MNSNLIVASWFGLALMWCAAGESASLDIAQIPLASCVTDTEYRSASAVAADSVGGIVYQAKFKAADWSGQLLAYPINTDGSIGTTATWEAGSVLPNDYTLRRPYSFFFPDDDCNSGGSLSCPDPLLTGTVFKWASTATLPGLSELQKNLINWGPAGGYKQQISEYFAGSRLHEKPTGVFRQRSVLLGDLINSDPWFVGSEDFNYSSLPDAEGTSYQAFQNQKSLAVVGGNTPRPRMVYVGGNDGMLHGFEAGTWNSTSNKFDTGQGTEVFSFLPGNIINGNLKLRSVDPLTAQDHRYLVDGSPRAGDAYFSGAWHTVLLGTTGASPLDPSLGFGGRSIFALDVTNPNDFTTTATGVGKVLWEFTDNPSVLDAFGIGADYLDLGMTLSQPSLARMQNGKWAVIVGNGYNSQNQKPVLYLLDISLKPNDPKFIIAKISPCDAGSGPCPLNINGLSTPIAVDVDFDHKVDYIYAGDLQGNLWKFDVTSASSTNWAVANKGKPLFVACAKTTSSCGENDRQPITGKPQVGSVSPDQANALYGTSQTKPSVMVYFGTGKYLGLTDNKSASSSQQQTFYALWDHNTGGATTDNSIAGRSKLLQQTLSTDPITRKFTNTDGSQGTQTLTNVRVTSNNAPCYPKSCTTTTQHNGWYMDLTTPSASPSERSVGFPLLVGGNIVFTTFIPPAEFDPTAISCTTPSPSSWLMELDAITGKGPASPAIDLFGSGTQNGSPDGKVNTFDMVTVNSTAMAPSGIQSTVGILKTPAIAPGKGVDYKYLAGSTGGIQAITESAPPLGRVSWRQLR